MKRKTLKQAKPTRFVKKKVEKWKNAIFSKSSNVPILKICGVISDTYPSLKSLTKVMEDLVF